MNLERYCHERGTTQAGFCQKQTFRDTERLNVRSHCTNNSQDIKGRATILLCTKLQAPIGMLSIDTQCMTCFKISAQQHSPGIFDIFFHLYDGQFSVPEYKSDGLVTLTRKTTASRPSSKRWSYVSARYIIYSSVSPALRMGIEVHYTGRISTLPSIATGFSLIACRPRTARTSSALILTLECANHTCLR